MTPAQMAHVCSTSVIGRSRRIGDGARVGANAVVVQPVAPGVTVVGIPARPVERDPVRRPRPQALFVPYGTPCEETLDPLVRTVEALRAEMIALEARVAHLQRSQRADQPGD